jgi:hypothetical protein
MRSIEAHQEQRWSLAIFREAALIERDLCGLKCCGQIDPGPLGRKPGGALAGPAGAVRVAGPGVRLKPGAVGHKA